MRVLSLDLGEKRVGVAISDELKLIARPLEIIEKKNESGLIERIREIVSANNVEKIVVGEPINMNGTLGEKANEARAFSEKLESLLNIKVELFDERLTSSQANRILIGSDISRKKRKNITDKLAAQIMLQAYLDSRTKN